MGIKIIFNVILISEFEWLVKNQHLHIENMMRKSVSMTVNVRMGWHTADKTVWYLIFLILN